MDNNYKYKKAENTFLDVADLNSTYSQGSTSSRTTVIAGMNQTSNTIIAFGGIQNINIMQNKQNIPIPELGSCANAIVEGRRLPVQISMTKQYVNGKGLLYSLVSLIKDSSGPLSKSKNFYLNLYNTIAKKPFDMYISTYLSGNNITATPSINRLADCFIESYNLTVDANYGVIQESITIQASYVESAASANITYNVGSTGITTPNMDAFSNKSQLDSVGIAGLTNAHTFTLTIRDLAANTTNPATGNHRAIGGIGSFQFSISQPITAIPEIGSDRFALVPGKTQPFQLSFTKAFVNGNSLIASLNATATSSDTPQLNLNLAINQIKGVRKLGICIMNLAVEGFDFIEFDQCAFTSGGFSTGDGIVNMENCVFLGSGINQTNG